jgi:hypothetical protein
MSTQIKWDAEETIMLAGRLPSLLHDDELPGDQQELKPLRDKLFPNRTVDSVYMQAWDIQLTMGRGKRPANWREASAQIRAIATLFRLHPAEMTRLAHDIEALRQIRQNEADHA